MPSPLDRDPAALFPPLARADVASLVELSRDRAEDARSELAQHLVRFATADAALSDDEWRLLDDILVRLIGHMETTLRRTLSERVADMEMPPAQILRALAFDEAEVAQPVLSRGQGLSDVDLVDIVRRLTVEHRMAVAERRNISAPVSAALVEQGEAPVVRTLLENRSARISRSTFRRICRTSEGDADLQKLMIARQDAPRNLLADLFWAVASEYRRKILDRFDLDLEVLKRRFQEGAEDALYELQADPVAAAAVNTLRDQPVYGQSGADALATAIRSGRIEAVVDAVARTARVSRETARRMAHDESGEALALLAKSLGMQKTQFVQLFLALDRVRGGAPKPFSHADNLGRLFDQIKWEGAEFLMRYWADPSTVKQTAH
ncbi:DUF2336 domain-containing protein [Futiania mangrovi]|uniref:DUF2336 domain-containing protein n=1 Tax=Futiania mangrovi TaxID=2959716 RepID=A0A9J6PIM2_9PROT|nr:DUF2336 domain-containing protein [Futiania mangrovii]MCP1337656.1 DUF2336 domain-containing protein [Futiania mangrovii]